MDELTEDGELEAIRHVEVMLAMAGQNRMVPVQRELLAALLARATRPHD